mmetsp:Transcript_26704/g.29926  ORF Transcript_26704/g.29926 Transcript_26704/m.29926 type:complete len:233 (-) Transcript_26704:256-954(-)
MQRWLLHFVIIAAKNPNHQNFQAWGAVWVKIRDLNGKVTTIVEKLSKEERDLCSCSGSQNGRFIHHSCCPMNFHYNLLWPDFGWRVSKHGWHDTKFKSLDVNLEQLGWLCGVHELPQFMVRKISSWCMIVVTVVSATIIGSSSTDDNGFMMIPTTNAVGMKNNILRNWFFSWLMIWQCAIECMCHAMRQFLDNFLFEPPLVVGTDGKKVALFYFGPRDCCCVFVIEIERDTE